MISAWDDDLGSDGPHLSQQIPRPLQQLPRSFRGSLLGRLPRRQPLPYPFQGRTQPLLNFRRERRNLMQHLPPRRAQRWGRSTRAAVKKQQTYTDKGSSADRKSRFGLPPEKGHGFRGKASTRARARCSRLVTSGVKTAASVASAAPRVVFAKGGVAWLPILPLKGKVRFFPSLPLLLIDRPDGPVMLVGRLDVPVIRSPRSPFEPPGQGGRREGRDQEEGNKTSAHCGSPCVVPLC